MISTKDLMIGNWVYMEAHRGYEAQYIQVVAIPDASSKDHCGHIGAFPVGVDNDFRDIEDRHLFPIPLTAEILEKNGFVYTKPQKSTESEDKVWQYQNNEKQTLIEIEEQMDDNLLDFYIGNFICGTNSCEIYFRHVHHLQHVLWLCGIEKEIEI